MTAHRNDLHPEHLLDLSNQVSRIATTLARLSSQADPSPAELDDADIVPEIPVKLVTRMIRARRMRSRFFDETLFADPAWDMMLDLFEAELAQRRVAVSSLCVAASVPATTGLRWLKAMTEKGLFIRRSDPMDGRRIYVELAPHTSRALSRYFGAISEESLI